MNHKEESPLVMDKFMESWDALQAETHQAMIMKGFHNPIREDGTLLALMHSELSEALEALRQGDPLSRKIPAHTSVEEELADTVIRIMDFGGLHGLNISGAIIAKLLYNQIRPEKHGKEF